MTKRSYHCLELWLKFPEEMDHLQENGWEDKHRLLPEAEREELEGMVAEVGGKACDEVCLLLGDIRERFQEIISGFSYSYKKGTKEKTISSDWYFDIPFYPAKEKTSAWIMTLGCCLFVIEQKTELVAWVWRQGSSPQNIQDNLKDIVIGNPEGWQHPAVAVIGRATVRDSCDNFEWDKAIEEITNRIRHLCEENKLLDRLAKDY